MDEELDNAGDAFNLTLLEGGCMEEYWKVQWRGKFVGLADVLA
jgi:hypothetical protein